MNYKELVMKVSEDTGARSIVVRRVIDALRDTILESIENGDSVKIPRLGSFQMIEHSPTRRRNPITGEIWEIPARRKPRFKFSSVAEDNLGGESDG